MSAVIAQLEELRRQTQRQQVVAGCSIDEQSFREALRRAAPALIEAARVVSEAGDWLCETPIPRIGSNGVAEDWEDWGSCFGCRLNGARAMLAEVELGWRLPHLDDEHGSATRARRSLAGWRASAGDRTRARLQTGHSTPPTQRRLACGPTEPLPR
jgi:hypothetical protein